jgi:hypothetical protein
MPEPKRPRLSALGIRPPNGQKAMSGNKMIPDGLLRRRQCTSGTVGYSYRGAAGLTRHQSSIGQIGQLAAFRLVKCVVTDSQRGNSMFGFRGRQCWAPRFLLGGVTVLPIEPRYVLAARCRDKDWFRPSEPDDLEYEGFWCQPRCAATGCEVLRPRGRSRRTGPGRAAQCRRTGTAIRRSLPRAAYILT